MVALPAFSQRHEHGIDSLERGILFATISLLAVVRDPADTRPKDQRPFYNAISLGFERETVAIAIDLPYSLAEAARTAFDLVRCCLPVNAGAIPPALLRPSPPTTPPFWALPPEPPEVDTLERYAVWCASLLAAANPAVTIRPTLTSRDGLNPTIEIKGRIPLTYSLWLCSTNLIRSVVPLIFQDPFVAVFASGSSAVGQGELLCDAS